MSSMPAPRRMSFLAPFALSFLIFGVYPIIRSIMLSLYITSGPEAQRFVGLDNYRHLLQDPDFWTAFGNTATFAIGSVVLQLPAQSRLWRFCSTAPTSAAAMSSASSFFHPI